MLTKQKLKVGCWYVPEPEEEFATIDIAVSIECLEEDQDLSDNEEINKLTETALKAYGDIESFSIETVEKAGAPYEDWVGYQEMLEEKGQQRLKYIYCLESDVENALKITGMKNAN